MEGLGEEVQKRWNSESVDPFRRIFYPDGRPRNAPMRSWRGVADGPLNSPFSGADLVGSRRLKPAWVFTHRGLRIDYHKGREGEPIRLDHQDAISRGVQMKRTNYTNSPSFIDNAATGRGYLDSAKVAVSLAAWIREIGWPFPEVID